MCIVHSYGVNGGPSGGSSVPIVPKSKSKYCLGYLVGIRRYWMYMPLFKKFQIRFADTKMAQSIQHPKVCFSNCRFYSQIYQKSYISLRSTVKNPMKISNFWTPEMTQPVFFFTFIGFLIVYYKKDAHTNGHFGS